MVELYIEGNPIPWKRAGRRRINGDVITYDRQLKEKEKIRWNLRSHFKGEPFTVPLDVTIEFKMPIPKSASRKQRQQMISGYISHMKRPDLDNLAKFILDCMTGPIFNDDAQIYSLNLKKQYGSDPVTKISIEPKEHNIAYTYAETSKINNNKEEEYEEVERKRKSRKSDERIFIGNFAQWVKEGTSCQIPETSCSHCSK